LEMSLRKSCSGSRSSASAGSILTSRPGLPVELITFGVSTLRYPCPLPGASVGPGSDRRSDHIYAMIRPPSLLQTNQTSVHRDEATQGPNDHDLLLSRPALDVQRAQLSALCASGPVCKSERTFPGGFRARSYAHLDSSGPRRGCSLRARRRAAR
jgi:hypothetical protein